MKCNNKKKIFIVLTFAVLLLFIHISVNIYLNYRAGEKVERNVKSIEDNINSLKDCDTVRLNELTEFDWDTVYMYVPYTVDISNNEAFAFDTRGLNISAPLSDSDNFIVFVSDNTAVCGLFGRCNYTFKYDYTKDEVSPKIIKKADNAEFEVIAYDNGSKYIILKQ